MAVGSTVATSDKHPLDQVLPFGQMFIYGLQAMSQPDIGAVADQLGEIALLRLAGVVAP